MNPVANQAQIAIQNAKKSLKAGDKRSARRWADEAVALIPNREEPWLLLAVLASPRASIAYLDRALEINPKSKRARQGMHWAITRYRNAPRPRKPPRQIILPGITQNSFTRNRAALLPWLVILFLITVGTLFWFSTPTLSFAISPLNALELAQTGIEKSTFTPTPTHTFTPTPTDTPTPTPTQTLTPTSTPTASPTPLPTNTPKPPKVEGQSNSQVALPSGVEPGERWIDVDLTKQRVYAYKGKNLLNAFVTSTGTWQHPTVTGQFKIYVKYRYADMAGPGYYLPSVPFVMYFYKGYGVHGTYWHNNFGTPMSHGCVNLRTADAGWVYNWASIGTVVNIHY